MSNFEMSEKGKMNVLEALEGLDRHYQTRLLQLSESIERGFKELGNDAYGWKRTDLMRDLIEFSGQSVIIYNACWRSIKMFESARQDSDSLMNEAQREPQPNEHGIIRQDKLTENKVNFWMGYKEGLKLMRVPCEIQYYVEEVLIRYSQILKKRAKLAH